MKKLIVLLVITFLYIGTANAYITAEERKKFDDGLQRIEQRNSNYRARKEVQRQKYIKRIKQKRKKVIRKKQLEDIGKRHTAMALEKRRRDTEESKRRARKGDCFADEVNGGLICK